ncbi:MAG: thiamine phosphate synthase [Pyrinomonadaceae bacterium]
MKIDTSKPVIYLITRGTLTDDNYSSESKDIIDTIAFAARRGIAMVQIRERSIGAGRLFDLARRAVEATRSSRTKVLVNDRVDVAAAAGCDGVHLTTRSIAADEVRRQFGEGLIIGVSTHNAAELDAAARTADFAVFGPVFATPGKTAIGASALGEAVERVRPFPVLALGGVDKTNIAAVLASGAAGFAAIRLLNDRAGIEAAARESGL